jgi:hypothetical protein
VLRIAADHCERCQASFKATSSSVRRTRDKGEGQHAQNEQQLAEREEELGFAEDADAPDAVRVVSIRFKGSRYRT